MTLNNNQPNRTPTEQILGPVSNISNNFVQGFYSFIFQNWNGLLNEITLAVNPEEFEQTESSTSNVVLTAGDVFTDSFGPGLTNIRISGTFGQRPVINGAQGSGQLEILKLRNLFRKYLDSQNPITTPSPSKNNSTKLMFFNYKDNEFWQIEPVGTYFNLRKSRKAPFLYRYDLNFTATNRVGNNYLESFIYFFDSNSQISSFLNDTDTLVSNITDDIDNITTIMNLGVSQIAANSFVNSVFAPLQQLSSAVSDFTQSVSQVINFPQNVFNSIISNCQSIQNEIQTLTFTYDATNNVYIPTRLYDPRFSNILRNTIINCNSYQLYSNNFIQTYVRTNFINQTTPPPDPTINILNINQIQSVTYYTIQNGDTLEGIASTLLGDPNFWRLLAEFNNLSYPYISTLNPQPQKTLAPGQQISIPSLASNPTSSFSTNIVLSQFQAPPSINSSFGTDIFLDSTGDIDASPNQDILTVTGINNLNQAILLKLNIYRGELLAHSDYGILNILGIRTLPSLTAITQSQLEATLLSDPRISNVVNSKVSVQGDVASFQAEALPNFGAPPIILGGTFAGAN
jgi:hypothetical protein